MPKGVRKNATKEPARRGRPPKAAVAPEPAPGNLIEPLAPGVPGPVDQGIELASGERVVERGDPVAKTNEPRRDMYAGISRPPGRYGLVEAKLPAPPPGEPQTAPGPSVAAPPAPQQPQPTPPWKVGREAGGLRIRHQLVAAFKEYVGDDEPDADEWARTIWLQMADHARYSSSMPPALAAVLIRIAAEIEEAG